MRDIFIALVFFFRYSVGEIGDKCPYFRTYCSTLSIRERCVDGICICNPDIVPRFSWYDMEMTTLNESCDIRSHNRELFDSPSCRRTNHCSGNFTCMDRNDIDEGAFSMLTLHKMICVCKDGFLQVARLCRPVSYQRVLQPCYIPINTRSPILWCNAKENSYCERGRCICYDKYFANTTSGKCEPMKDYVKLYGISEYRVKMKQYCRRDEHCIEGLQCKNYTCGCPNQCTYNGTKDACNCGKTDPEPLTILGPVIFGTAIGVLIISFWILMIKETVDSFKSERERQVRVNNASHRNHNQESPSDAPTLPTSIDSLPRRHSSISNSNLPTQTSTEDFQPSIYVIQTNDYSNHHTVPETSRASTLPSTPPPPYEQVVPFRGLQLNSSNNIQPTRDDSLPSYEQAMSLHEPNSKSSDSNQSEKDNLTKL